MHTKCRHPKCRHSGCGHSKQSYLPPRAACKGEHAVGRCPKAIPKRVSSKPTWGPTASATWAHTASATWGPIAILPGALLLSYLGPYCYPAWGPTLLVLGLASGSTPPPPPPCAPGRRAARRGGGPPKSRRPSAERDAGGGGGGGDEPEARPSTSSVGPQAG